MSMKSPVTDEQLGLAIAQQVSEELARSEPVDGRRLLDQVVAAAPAVRRQRRQVRVAAAAVAGALALAASVAWGLGGLHRSDSTPSPPATPSPSGAKSLRSTGTLGPGDVVGRAPAGLLSAGPYSAVPRIPAGVRWGASAAQLQDDQGNAKDLVAFPIPADATLQPADLGAERVFVGLEAAQSTNAFPVIGVGSCTRGYDPGQGDVVAALGVSLTPTAEPEQPPGAPARSAPDGSLDTVREIISAFQGNGAHQAVNAAAPMARSRCLERAAPLVALPTAGLPGDEAFAGLGHETGVNQQHQWDFLGLARVGQVTVTVTFSADDSTARADVVAKGGHLLTAAVARVQTSELNALVARYVR